MPLTPPTEDQQAKVNKVMSSITQSYMTLIKNGYTDTVLPIARTDDPKDEDYVCELMFEETCCNVIITVKLIDVSLNFDDLFTLLERTDVHLIHQAGMKTKSISVH